MDIQRVQELLLQHYGIRVQPAMGEYVLRRLRQAEDALREFPVMGGDARTGVPVRQMVSAERLAGDQLAAERP